MTFKTVLPLVVAVSFLTLGSCPVYAQSSKSVRPLPAQADLMQENDATRGGQNRERTASRAAEPRARVASGAATLKERLATFRDKRKATLIEKIYNNLTSINQRRTSQMMTHVDKLANILTRAESRAITAEGNGINITDAQLELGLAKTALANAKIAVEEQAKKTYDIEIASESGARVEVQDTRDLFHQDLKATHNLVREARRVLINALMKLGQSLGESTEGAQNGTN